MSQKQLSSYVAISRLIERKITVKEAAMSLGLSSSQILRFKRRVREFGAGALIHKNTGSRPHHKIEDSLKEKIIYLKRSPIYSNTNFCHFQELLEEYEHIKISYSALYTLLSQAGIVSLKKRRHLKVHRKRKGQKGLLVQIDASLFNWLEDGNDYHLYGAIDDASGKIVGVYLTKEECLLGYFR